MTYALVILLLICGLSLGIIRALQTNPFTYRQATLSLLTLTNEIPAEFLGDLNSDRVNFSQLQQYANQNNLWLVVVRSPDLLVANTREEMISKVNIRRAIRNFADQPERIYRFTDGQRQAWLFMIQQVSPDTFLFSGIEQPRLPAFSLFRNELVDPIFKAGAVALFLGILLSLTISAWIANPLKEMAKAAQGLASGNGQKVPLEGPKEVQELGGALNRMSDQVKASQDSQKDFIANVSHELKTPLTSIQGYAQALSDGTLETGEDVQKTSSVILGEAQRMNRLVMDLLSLARLEAGTADLMMQTVDIPKLLESLAEKFSLQADEKQISLNRDLCAVPTIMGDGDRLAQVFGNLIDNALKFTPPGGLIKISCQSSGDWVEIRVADSGLGIPEQDLPRIFERFYQVERSRQRVDKKGVGLGLAISRQIILAHQGQIHVQSEVGQGSVFVVKLPVSNRINL